MFNLDQLKGVLDQYSGASADQPPQNVHDHFDQAAQNLPQDTLADGISHAFQSGQTAPFHQMVSQLFSTGNPQQRTGLLNQLVSAAGSSGISAGGGGLSGLANLFKGGNTKITPQQAQQISPQQVEQLAQHINNNNPSAIDQISGFVSQHPGWFKTLGAGALTVAMAKMAEHHHV
jgi:hypothetical protein